MLIPNKMLLFPALTLQDRIYFTDEKMDVYYYRICMKRVTISLHHFLAFICVNVNTL